MGVTRRSILGWSAFAFGGCGLAAGVLTALDASPGLIYAGGLAFIAVSLVQLIRGAAAADGLRGEDPSDGDAGEPIRVPDESRPREQLSPGAPGRANSALLGNFALITGGAGFIGSNLANRLLHDGRRVRILDDLSRPGSERNLRWLTDAHGERLEVDVADLRDEAAVQRCMRGASEIFHFAARLGITTSLDVPLDDAGVNLNGTLSLLEGARMHAPEAPLVFASTSKVYGSLADLRLFEAKQRYEPAETRFAHGVAEDRPLAFTTPYGCSKGAADQYVLDYAHSYGLPAAALRMSSVYGPRQYGGEEQGWVAHFLISAVDGEPITIYGDGKQVRDVLFVDDLVEAALLARDRIADLAGHAFNIGGGSDNAVSVIEVLQMIHELRGYPPETHAADWRAGDMRYYVSDTRRFSAMTGWKPIVPPSRGLWALHEWVLAERGAQPVGAGAFVV